MKATPLLPARRLGGFVLMLSGAALLAASAASPHDSMDRPANPTPQEIFRLRVFAEPLVIVGGEPSAVENADLLSALKQYSRRSSQDEFASLTGYVARHPESPWNASLLCGLGMEYYNTVHYSKALAAWEQAWQMTKARTDTAGKTVADRALGELAFMYGRLGRMTELDSLLQSVAERVVVGPATERLAGAREGLWNMQHRPEIAFRCGPQALLRIQKAILPDRPADMTVYECASTQRGMSLPQVAALGDKIGLHYQMAFRERDGEFLVPAVVHWKLGHYAAIIRKEGDKYLLQDPTFLNDVWATREALEAESSGYFLVRPGALPEGWRRVAVQEGETVWGKGNTQTKDPGLGDSRTPSGPCKGMAVASVNLMLVSLHLQDEPVGYSPPVGPPVRFTVSYNHRDAFQPGTFTYTSFGPKWTCEWLAYITDNPQNPSADVNYYVPGGGNRTFTGFNAGTQVFAFQTYDQTRLKRTGPASYEMLWRDGSRRVFAQSDGSSGTTRKVFLSQVIDPQGNTVTLNYDGNLRIANIVDAIGQVTTLTYSTNDVYKVVRVTDPFGRFATFGYDQLGRLTNITDVIGMSSRFTYETTSDYVNALITPYGTNTFIRGENGTTRWLETVYADGSRDRVEFNQSTSLGIPNSDPVSSVPKGMNVNNNYLYYRNTYYWSRTACASSYGDYSKARVYHWLHTADVTMCSGVLESTKEPLEGRVWLDYAGQGDPIFIGANNRPTHVGRVLDDGSTQLYTYGYNGFGNLTNAIDPLGRTISYLYATNGIDLLEVRMTRAGKNELLYQATYNDQHLPLTTAGADGQSTTNTYNARGQLLTRTNPKGETTAYTYSTNGYLVAVDGPLPGTNDMVFATYDAFGRTLTRTDDSGYSFTLEHDSLDRVTRITFPDTTFEQITYDRLDPHIIRDRAGRQTVLEHTPLGQLAQRTDPLGRTTRYQWCNCGNVKSLTDPIGRTTEWETDVQGRLITKRYGDGSRISYQYEKSSGRLRQIIDEKLQFKQFSYNRDNTLRSISYINTAVATPTVTFTWDPDYRRLSSMADGTGVTSYSYKPVSISPVAGAGRLASIDGPLTDDIITYDYDELGRPLSTAINGASMARAYDSAGRVTAETNLLGVFQYTYVDTSIRVSSQTFPNGLLRSNYYGGNLLDHSLTNTTYTIGATRVSEFSLIRDVAARRITTWSQQHGLAAPDVNTCSYDAANRLLLVNVTNSGAWVNTFNYVYDDGDNRLQEVDGGITNTATYNALNQITATTSPRAMRTNEWDGENRLAAIVEGNTRTEYGYDGLGRLTSIRQLTNNVESSFRRLLWCDNQVAEERDASGQVVKRFFEHGMRVAGGNNSGDYFFSRDHLRSVRELTDAAGNVRARYKYSPFGNQTLVSGDVPSDFGFAGMFWSTEANLFLTRFRAYDPALGRWLSRDPLRNAEELEGPNLYAYVRNNPVNAIDPLGLCCEQEMNDFMSALTPGLTLGLSPECQYWKALEMAACMQSSPECPIAKLNVATFCQEPLRQRWIQCMARPCDPPPCPVKVGGGAPGGGFPKPPSRIGKFSDIVNDESVYDVATYSTGRPAERHAAESVHWAPPYDE